METKSASIAFAIASSLSQMNKRELQDYLANTYGIHDTGILSVNVIYICQVRGGDFRQPAISSDPIRFWKLAGSEPIDIPHIDMRAFNDACDHGSELWPHPIISFYLDCDSVLLCEGIGPMLKCYKKADIILSGNSAEIANYKVLRVLK